MPVSGRVASTAGGDAGAPPATAAEARAGEPAPYNTEKEDPGSRRIRPTTTNFRAKVQIKSLQSLDGGMFIA
jgi:hypothetical protein